MLRSSSTLVALATLLAAPAVHSLVVPTLALPTRPAAAAGRPRTALTASAAETEALTLTLTGCGSGIGVGLDGDNCVDMLKPGMPAAKVLQMGDRVVSWNGIAMMEDGNQRMLKDVVTPAESHELVVERVRASPPISLEDVDWDNGLTCVEFMADNELRLGVYVSYTQVESEPHIRPLCASSADEGVGALLCDEGVPSAPLSSVRRVLDPDYVFVSERQAGGGQGLGNPHGEHGEECYDLRDLKLSPNVRVVVQEGRDQERVL
tara:strand:+ start:108 stop:896 length:789 start_codon:yes stop_codon:yes gene_type:complete